MFHRKSLALVAACATLAFGGLVRAADGGSSSSPVAGSQLTSDQQPAMLDDAPAPPARPLTAGLNATPVGKPLSDANIAITGFVEGSTTFIDHTQPGNNAITGRSFDTESDSLLLNAIDLNVQRTVDSTQKKFDIGFDVEQMYGADMAYIHSNGLTTYSPSKIGGARQPKNQYDLTQANLVFALPVGNGLSLLIGKFITPLGAEVIDAPGNAFYSHSFLFGQLPFTQTGVTATYNLCPEMTVMLGVTRGWDQALRDVNGDLDLLANATYTSDDKKWTDALTISSGNQSSDASGLDGWRTVIDYVGSYQYSDNLKLTLNADYGWQSQVDAGGTAQWYGVAVYAGYTISDYVTLNGRGEWFNDEEGLAPGEFDGGAAAATGSSPSNTYYEATLGLSIKPMPHNNIGSNLVIRPEVRDDYANKATWGNPASPTHNQATLAIEGYFTF
jgi:Putative beta-barrel porin-2, OmpL-like. bbp2